MNSWQCSLFGGIDSQKVAFEYLKKQYSKELSCTDCCLYYKIFKLLDDSRYSPCWRCCVYGNLCCCGWAWNRRAVRKGLNIKGSCLGDCCIHCCCHCYAITQELKEVAHYRGLNVDIAKLSKIGGKVGTFAGKMVSDS